MISSDIIEFQVLKNEEQIYFEVSNLFYNAQILHHQLAFIDSNILNSKKLLSNLELLKEQLLVKGTDVSKIKLQIEQLNTQRESIKNKNTQVLNTLKSIMGIPINKDIEINSEIITSSANANQNTTPLDIQIISLQNNFIKSELSILKKSRFLPTVNLFGTFGINGFGYNNDPNSFLNFYKIGFVGLQLSQPIFNGTVTQRKIIQKNLELQNNELKLDWVVKQQDLQIENIKLQISSSSKIVETTIKQIDFAKGIYEQTLLQQRQGMANLTDVLLADNALRETQQAYISNLIDFLKADLELKRLTGQLSSKN